MVLRKKILMLIHKKISQVIRIICSYKMSNINSLKNILFQTFLTTTIFHFYFTYIYYYFDVKILKKNIIDKQNIIKILKVRREAKLQNMNNNH